MKLEIKSFAFLMSEDEVVGYSNKPSWEICHVDIGERGEEGADIFTLHICNTKWINERVSKDGVAATQAVLIIDDLTDHELITKYIEKTFFTEDYESMESFADKCGDLMTWEFAAR